MDDLSIRVERRRDARHWFETTLGQYVLAQEQAHFDATVSDIFGYNALQLGLPQFDLLRASRMPLHLTLDAYPPAQVHTDFSFLPISNQSVDLVVMPHLFEFSATPHQILREVERILIPEGHVIITGFNPFSLWGCCHVFKKRYADYYPWNGKFISLLRIKDWLALMGLEVMAGRMSCYVPPVQNEKWRSKFQFMEAAGDRWWPLAGGVYYLLAKKRVQGMRLITPKWKDRLATQQRVAPVAQKGVLQCQTQKENERV